MNILVAQSFDSGPPENARNATKFVEVIGGLTRGELEVLADKLKRGGGPQSPPHPGHWKLVSLKAHRSEFPEGMSFKDLAARGKVRIESGKWFRLFRVVARWILVDNSAPRGVAALNKAKQFCVHGHPLEQVTKGRRRCKVCAIKASAKSRLKAKQKRTSSLGKTSLRRSAPRPRPAPPSDIRVE
jgi:hypothetical protein